MQSPFFFVKNLATDYLVYFWCIFFDIKKSHKSILQELVRPIWRRERDYVLSEHFTFALVYFS